MTLIIVSDMHKVKYQHRFPLQLRKPDPETSISTPVPTRLFQSRFGLFTSPESLFTCPESLFTSSRNLYSHRPGIGIHMPRNTQPSDSGHFKEVGWTSPTRTRVAFKHLTGLADFSPPS